jgi:Na+-transporting NADH:ubiquinone oxidoreductase subunit B
MKFIHDHFEKLRPLFSKGGKLEKLFPLFEAKETFMFVLPQRTTKGAHIRDALDTKRLMSMVIVALLPALLFGM